MNNRERFRKDLSPLYLPCYDGLCELLPDKWQPYQGFRSIKYQAELYATGRTKPGKNVTDKRPMGDTVTDAKPGYSPHCYGCATDWTIYEDKEPIWMLPGDLRFHEYEIACEKLGLVWGGKFRKRTDYYHNELYISCAWSEVQDQLETFGMDAAQAFIRNNRSK